MPRRNNNPQRYMMPQMNQMPTNNMPNPMYPTMQAERLQYEVMENRRRIDNLAKRMTRVESYLRIHDTSEYGYIEEEDKPSSFSY